MGRGRRHYFGDGRLQFLIPEQTCSLTPLGGGLFANCHHEPLNAAGRAQGAGTAVEQSGIASLGRALESIWSDRASDCSCIDGDFGNPVEPEQAFNGVVAGCCCRERREAKFCADQMERLS